MLDKVSKDINSLAYIFKSVSIRLNRSLEPEKLIQNNLEA